MCCSSATMRIHHHFGDRLWPALRMRASAGSVIVYNRTIDIVTSTVVVNQLNYLEGPTTHPKTPGARRRPAPFDLACRRAFAEGQATLSARRTKDSPRRWAMGLANWLVTGDITSYWFSITTIQNAIATQQKIQNCKSAPIFIHWGSFRNREKRLVTGDITCYIPIIISMDWF